MSEDENRKNLQELDALMLRILSQDERFSRDVEEQFNSLRKYRYLFYFAPVGLALTDIKGRIVETNLILNHLLGYDGNYLTGKSFHSFLVRRDKDAFFLHLRKVAKTKKTLTQKLTLQGKDCRQIPVQIRMSFGVGVEPSNLLFLSFSELTRIKDAESLLMKKEHEMRTLSENADGIIARFDKSLRHVYVNPDIERITGVKRDEYLGKTNRELGMPEDICHLGDTRILSVFRTQKEQRFEFIFPIHRNERTFEALMIPERDKKGTVTNVLCICRDISEKKRAQEAVSQLNRELQSKARELEAINREQKAFTSAVSHDLRAPLRSIKGFSEALLEDYLSVLGTKGRNYLSRISRAVQSMESLIDSLLKLSSLSMKIMDVQKLNLSALARNFADELKKEHPGNNTTFVIEEGLSALGDFELLRIAVQNLFRNAWKFTSHKPEPRIEFGVTMENQSKKPCFYVRDNGVGFDMAYAHKLFQPFQRLHSGSEYKGSGIGLTTVQRIVERHGGKVWARGEPGQGAVFYFTLET